MSGLSLEVSRGGRSVRSGLSGSSGYGLEVVGFVRVHRVRWGALFSRPVVPWRSLGSFGLVSFIRVRPKICWVRSGSSGSSGCALGVDGFVRVPLVPPGAPFGLLSSFRFVGFVWLPLAGRLVAFGSSVRAWSRSVP